VAQLRSLLFFAAFCGTASAVYVFNDWMDIESDRAHPHKRHRPLASGRLSRRTAALLALVAVAVAVLCATPCGPVATSILVFYVLLNIMYTVRLKRVALLDVIVLALYYVIRVVGGAAAANVTVSPWLSSMCMFLFLSIAIAKRYAELKAGLERQATANSARGYRHNDVQLLSTVGTNCGLLAVLILTLYINSDHVTTLYARPSLIWCVCPLLLYWICRVWLLATRGELEEDPVVFALRDKVSHGIFIACALIVWLAGPLS